MLHALKRQVIVSRKLTEGVICCAYTTAKDDGALCHKLLDQQAYHD